MQLLSPLVLLALAALGMPAQAQNATVPTPAAPGLDFLFSCNVSVGLSVKVGTGVKNTTRAVFPVYGGQAIGPRVQGKVLEIGADWASYGTLLNGVNVADDDTASKNPNATKYFATDARFQLLTLDGANIFVATQGQTAPGTTTGAVHVRATLETASAAYSWVNGILVVGVLRTNSDGYQIDLWQLTTP
ncbi:hypothetical protein SPBR_03282 [Sporothrix brasiliensis 5110]|uniref:Uncharacterized protein n=1 Tax=Sporothrix brasiliensis 5110 TaxID=1398154 RepID=A0A0C2F153_9PEZI|nr:uncharacterized protein SPBR_03282 [Sporothrix brasiliensis 5110]KIH92594.1 hypothetical protein SPBR_03282 [Sporothrix brasiliensis 5110]